MWRRLFRIPPPFRGVSGESIRASYQSDSAHAKTKRPPRLLRAPWAEGTPEAELVEGDAWVVRIEALAFPKNPTLSLSTLSPLESPREAMTPNLGDRSVASLRFDEGQWLVKPLEAPLFLDGQPVTAPTPLEPGAVVEVALLGQPPAAWVVEGDEAATSAPCWIPARCGALTVREEDGRFHAVLRGGGYGLGLDTLEWVRRLAASALPTALASLELHVAPTSPSTDVRPFTQAVLAAAANLPLEVTVVGPGARSFSSLHADSELVRPFGAGLAVHPGREPVFLNGGSVPLSGWCTLVEGDVLERWRGGVLEQVTVERARTKQTSARPTSDSVPWALFPGGELPDTPLVEEDGAWVLRHGDEVRRWRARADGVTGAVEGTPFDGRRAPSSFPELGAEAVDPVQVAPRRRGADATGPVEETARALRNGHPVAGAWTELHELQPGEVPATRPTPFFTLVRRTRDDFQRALTGFLLLPGPSDFLRGRARLPDGPLTAELVAVFADTLAARGDCAAPGLIALAEHVLRPNEGTAMAAQAWHERLLGPWARTREPEVAKRTLLLRGEHCAGFFTRVELTPWRGLAAELKTLVGHPLLQRLERLELVGDGEAQGRCGAEDLGALRDAAAQLPPTLAVSIAPR